MSDISINFPFVLVLALAGALFWPVTVAIAVVFAVAGAIVPKTWMRVVCFLLAAVLAADCLFGIWLGRDPS